MDVGNAVLFLIRSVVNLVKFVFQLVGNIIKAAREMGFFTSVLKTVGDFLQLVGTYINELIEFIKFISPVLMPVIKLLLFLGKLWFDIMGILFRSTEGAIKKINPALKAFVSFIEELWGSFSTWIINTWNFIVETGMKLWNDFIIWLSALWNGFVGIITNIWNTILNVFFQAREKILEFLQPVIDFMNDLITMINDKVLGAINKVKSGIDKVKSFFGFGTGNVARVNPGAAVGAGAGKTAVNNIAVNSKVDLSVPAGTTEEQRTFLEGNAKKAVSEEWDSILRQLQGNTAPVEFVR